MCNDNFISTDSLLNAHANFTLSVVELSLTKLLTFVASYRIRDKLCHSHPVVTHPDLVW